ncbi:hypothetical protein RQP46_002796 [Phenoliferia psychrophenolica]
MPGYVGGARRAEEPDATISRLDSLAHGLRETVEGTDALEDWLLQQIAVVVKSTQAARESLHSTPEIPSPPPISQLPSEVLDVIMFFSSTPLAPWDHFLMDYSADFVLPPPTERRRLETLRSCALVCRHWRGPAQRALTAEVVSYRDHGPDEFSFQMEFHYLEREHYTLRRKSGAFGRFAVKKLWIHLSEREDGSDVKKMPWSLLLAPSLSGLLKLELMWPEGFLDPPTPLLPLPFQLSSLSIWLENAPTPAFLGALFASCRETLNTLHLRSEHPDVTLDAQRWLAPVLPSVAPRIRHLVLEQSVKAPWILLHNGLADFTALETLRLGVVSSPARDWILTQALFDSTIATLPPSAKLRRLTLGIRKRVNIDRVRKFLEHPQLAALEQVNFPLELKKEKEETVAGEAFMKACWKRGIKVAMRQDLGQADAPPVTFAI